MDDPNENLLLRWSRRKHEAQRQKEAAPAPSEPVPPTEAQGAADTVSVAEAPPEPAPAEGTVEPASPAVDLVALPNIETLTYESDFTAFMREGVPEVIKQAALRKLWNSDPILANLDGLNDYDPKTMSFLQQFEGAAEQVAEVGRGLRDKIMEAKRAREERPRGGRGHPRDQRPTLQRPQQDESGRLVDASDEDVEVGDGETPAPDKRDDGM